VQGHPEQERADDHARETERTVEVDERRRRDRPRVPVAEVFEDLGVDRMLLDDKYDRE
jgi:hypothetical protein